MAERDVHEGWLLTQEGGRIRTQAIEALFPSGNKVVAWLSSGREAVVAACANAEEARVLVDELYWRVAKPLLHGTGGGSRVDVTWLLRKLRGQAA